jgi:integrase/recombinase XerD
MRKPFLKATHDCYYVKIDGKDVRLDPDKDKAETKFYQIMANRPDKLDGSNPGVKPLLDAFLEFVQQKRAKGSYLFYRHFVRSFAKTIPDKIKVSQLTPEHVTEWAGRLYTNPNTCRNAIRAIQRAFSWALKARKIQSSPLASVEKPAPVPKELYFTDEQYQQIVNSVDGGFKDLVVFMRLTGCRVQEVRTLTSSMLDHENRCFIIPKELAKGKKEARTINMTEEAYTMVKDKTGYIFVNTQGRPWTGKAIQSKCKHLADKLGFPITLGTLRKVFITHALINGVDVITLSKLVGHRTLTMINSVYSRLQNHADYMHDALDRAVKGV